MIVMYAFKPCFTIHCQSHLLNLKPKNAIPIQPQATLTNVVAAYPKNGIYLDLGIPKFIFRLDLASSCLLAEDMESFVLKTMHSSQPPETLSKLYEYRKLFCEQSSHRVWTHVDSLFAQVYHQAWSLMMKNIQDKSTECNTCGALFDKVPGKTWIKTCMDCYRKKKTSGGGGGGGPQGGVATGKCADCKGDLANAEPVIQDKMGRFYCATCRHLCNKCGKEPVKMTYHVCYSCMRGGGGSGGGYSRSGGLPKGPLPTFSSED
jgi:hypothetical protein